MQKIIITLTASLGIWLPQMLLAQGTLYLSNLGEASAGGTVVASDAWLAESFLTGTNSSGYYLNSIQLLMNQASGSPGGFNLCLYGNGAFPGHSLGGLSGLEPSTGGVYSYSNPSLTLLPSTYYFLVLTAATPTPQGSYSQSYSASFDYGSSDGWILSTYRYTSTDGSSWTRGGYPGYSFQFAVEATAIPEPSVPAIMVLGLVGMSLLRCRK